MMRRWSVADSAQFSLPLVQCGDYRRGVPTGRIRAACRLRLPSGRMLMCGVAAIAALDFIGGCNGSHLRLQAAPSGTGTTAPSGANVERGSSSASTVSPLDSGQDPAIIAAYEESLADFNMVATKAPVQGNDRRLAEHMDGRQLTYVFSQLLRLASAGEVDVGSLATVHARVKEFNDSEAVVEACGRDTIQIANASTGQVVQSAAPSTELVNALIQQVDGTWKVTYQSNVSPGCS